MRLRALPNNGLERYTTRQVAFGHPFRLGRAPEVYPAGSYDVEIREQAVEAGRHMAFVRASTTLIIPTKTGSFWREVDGVELDHALVQDSEQGRSSEPSENPDRGNTHGAVEPETLP